MEIAGKQIDVDEIIAEAAEICSEGRDGCVAFKSGRLDDVELRSAMEFHAWAGLIKHFAESPSLKISAEAALAEMVRKGLGKEEIAFRRNAFRIMLRNRKYRIVREERGFSAGPFSDDCQGRIRTCDIEGMSAKRFDEVIRAFDSIVPQIDTAADMLARAFMRQALEDEKNRMAREMTHRLVYSLVQEYLTPENLGCSYRINDDGTVSMTIERKMATEIRIPVADLAERLKDTEAIVSGMTACPPEEGVDDGDFPGRRVLCNWIP